MTIISKKTYSEDTGAVTRSGEADLDDAPDMLDPPESDSDGREGDRPEKASGM